FENSTVYGLRRSMYVIPQFSVDANLGRQKKFRFKDTTAGSHAFVFDLNGVYHLWQENAGAEPDHKFVPFTTLGVELLSADVNNGFATLTPNMSESNSVSLTDSSRFFTINYGGGVQASRLAGPIGMRIDARGRTAPNMIGSSVHF